MMQPALPFSPAAALSRRDVIALVDETGRHLGLSAACLQVLIRMVGATADADWLAPEAEPVYFGRQENLAERLGISPRQLRNHERRLERMGFADPSTLANGHRCATSRRGISLAPMKERLAELLARRTELREAHVRKRRLKAERGIARRRAVDVLRQVTKAELARPDVAAIAARVMAWPRADALLRMKPDVLDHHVADAVATVAELEDAVGAPRTAAPDAEGPRIRAVPAAATLDRLGELARPDRLVELASPEFRAAALAGSAGPPSEAGLMMAAEDRRVALGVGGRLWDEAVFVMGRETATLALLVVDANRDHPSKPTRKVGGAMTAIVAKAADGKFNLPGALIALDRRRARSRREAANG